MCDRYHRCHYNTSPMNKPKIIKVDSNGYSVNFNRFTDRKLFTRVDWTSFILISNETFSALLEILCVSFTRKK